MGFSLRHYLQQQWQKRADPVVTFPTIIDLECAARERGCRTLHGGGMVVFQAADSFELFTGVRPDRERMLRHFAELTA